MNRKTFKSHLKYEVKYLFQIKKNIFSNSTEDDIVTITRKFVTALVLYKRLPLSLSQAHPQGQLSFSPPSSLQACSTPHHAMCAYLEP